MKQTYLTIEEQRTYPESDPTYAVYRIGSFPRSSAAYGRTRREWLGDYATVAEAQEAHPGARDWTQPRTEDQVLDYQLLRAVLEHVEPRTLPNARFWILGPGCSPVKLTLRPHQSLKHGEFAYTDEGYSASETQWSWDGFELNETTETSSRDCDGSYRGGHDQCTLRGLLQTVPDMEPVLGQAIRWPEWLEQDGATCDLTAEAAGY